VRTDVVIVGGGPAGLSAAEAAASGGVNVLLLEKSSEIGYPIHTSGASSISELRKLGIPETFWHPIRKARFVSPGNCIVFEYEYPIGCVLDVRGVYQFLAERAVLASATIKLKTRVTDVLMTNGRISGVKAHDAAHGKTIEITSRIVIDASGFSSIIARKSGLHGAYKRYGVGAEYDLFAPHYNEDEMLLIVGSTVAPSGYGWAFPYGNHRVRVGIGLIHPDTKEAPEPYLDHLLGGVSQVSEAFKNAQAIEFHRGLIPSEGLQKKLVDTGVLLVGDAAGQASTLAGEGIRFAIKAGRMGGEVASKGVRLGRYSREFLLQEYQRPWETEYGKDLFFAHQVNKMMAKYSDDQWDRRIEALKRLTPEQFAQMLHSRFSLSWVAGVVARNPALIGKVAKKGLQQILNQITTVIS